MIILTLFKINSEKKVNINETQKASMLILTNQTYFFLSLAFKISVLDSLLKIIQFYDFLIKKFSTEFT